MSIVMDEKELLHTAARRYSIDRSHMWGRRYSEQSIDPSSVEAQNIYPRYHVLDAILVDVESIVPGDIATLDELKQMLVLAGRTAASVFTRDPRGPVEARAMDEERDQFEAYVRGLTTEGLRGVAPLPYRRSLGSGEHERLWAELGRRWGVREGAYWHPLLGEELPTGVLAFQAAWFDRYVPSDALQRILIEHDVRRLWELREFGPEYEIGAESFEPDYNGAEGYWTSGDMDWLVYASHESSITVAGDWLIAAIKNTWPQWEEHLYTDWDYEPPPGEL